MRPRSGYLQSCAGENLVRCQGASRIVDPRGAGVVRWPAAKFPTKTNPVLRSRAAVGSADGNTKSDTTKDLKSGGAMTAGRANSTRK